MARELSHRHLGRLTRRRQDRRGRDGEPNRAGSASLVCRWLSLGATARQLHVCRPFLSPSVGADNRAQRRFWLPPLRRRRSLSRQVSACVRHRRQPTGAHARRRSPILSSTARSGAQKRSSTLPVPPLVRWQSTRAYHAANRGIHRRRAPAGLSRGHVQAIGQGGGHRRRLAKRSQGEGDEAEGKLCFALPFNIARSPPHRFAPRKR